MLIVYFKYWQVKKQKTKENPVFKIFFSDVPLIAEVPLHKKSKGKKKTSHNRELCAIMSIIWVYDKQCKSEKTEREREREREKIEGKKCGKRDKVSR